MSARLATVLGAIARSKPKFAKGNTGIHYNSFFGFQERLDILAKAGLPIWITELDILERNETKRARALEHVMRVAFGHESVDGIILWAFWSSAAWRGADTALIDDDFNVSLVLAIIRI